MLVPGERGERGTSGWMVVQSIAGYWRSQVLFILIKQVKWILHIEYAYLNYLKIQL
jgi:hypothetical protein